MSAAAGHGQDSETRVRSRSPSVSSWPSDDTAFTPPRAVHQRSPRKSARPTRSPSYPQETDPVILARRQKQLDYGKNTLAYQQYAAAVPRVERKGYHPRTPVKRRQLSRRRWDHAIKCWRVQLHHWSDPAKLLALRQSNGDGELVATSADPVSAAGSGVGVQESVGGGGDAPSDSEASTGAAAAGTGVDDSEMDEATQIDTAKYQVEEFDWCEDVEGIAAELEK